MTRAAIYYHPEGYELTETQIMGRQSAGHGFLRAAVAARGEDAVVGFGAREDVARHFAATVRSLDPAATAEWIRSDHVHAFGKVGVCYRPDPVIGPQARLRQRAGPAQYSLCGVTHTTATIGTLGELANLFRDPVMPWDAVICTSEAVAKTIHRVHEAEAEYLKWRFGPEVRLAKPQLPVIPLGVHCADFDFDDAAKAQARRDLGLEDDETAILFVGRLSFTSKVHPTALYEALQAITGRTGHKLVLIECGWSPNKPVEEAFLTSGPLFCPDVRRIHLDGRQATQRDQAWAAGDIFVSLSDNIQETFGLTPLEAMAAGLPVVVTDWNGYREIVRDRIDGFRIPTRAPADGHFETVARAYEAGVMDYNRYIWRAAAATSVDMDALVDSLIPLIEAPELRRRMGQVGRVRARQDYDWSHVFRQYQTLWGDLNARRRAALHDPDEAARLAAAPRVDARALDPFDAFGHYPTAALTADSRVALAPGATLDRYRALSAHLFFTEGHAPEALVLPLWRGLAASETTVRAVAEAGGLSPRAALLAVGTLAKMGLVRTR